MSLSPSDTHLSTAKKAKTQLKTLEKLKSDVARHSQLGYFNQDECTMQTATVILLHASSSGCIVSVVFVATG